MLSRNDDPNIQNFNFGVDSVFNSQSEYPANALPPSGNAFLLSDGSNFLLSDGSNFLLSP
jgi:hypothetical protein